MQSAFRSVLQAFLHSGEVITIYVIDEEPVLFTATVPGMGVF